MKRTVRPWAVAILACAVSVALSIPVVLARDPGSGSSGRGPQMEIKAGPADNASRQRLYL